MQKVFHKNHYLPLLTTAIYRGIITQNVSYETFKMIEGEISMDSDTLSLLSRTFLFQGIEPGRVEELLGTVETTTLAFSRGEIIYSPERFRRELGIIISGVITVTKGPLTVSELHSGDLFGAAALFTDGERYVSTLTARVRSTILFLSQSAVESLIDADRRVRANYISYLAQRIRFLSAKVDALSGGSGGDKLSSYILQNAGPDGLLTVRSMTELASRLGIGRASLYRELSKLQAAGIIDHSGKTVKLLKPELLK